MGKIKLLKNYEKFEKMNVFFAKIHTFFVKIGKNSHLFHTFFALLSRN